MTDQLPSLTIPEKPAVVSALRQKMPLGQAVIATIFGLSSGAFLVYVKETLGLPGLLTYIVVGPVVVQVMATTS